MDQKAFLLLNTVRSKRISQELGMVLCTRAALHRAEISEHEAQQSHTPLLVCEKQTCVEMSIKDIVSSCRARFRAPKPWTAQHMCFTRLWQSNSQQKRSEKLTSAALPGPLLLYTCFQAFELITCDMLERRAPHWFGSVRQILWY